MNYQQQFFQQVNENDRLRAEIKKLQAELATARMKIDALEGEIFDLENDRDELEDELTYIKSKDDDDADSAEPVKVNTPKKAAKKGDK